MKEDCDVSLESFEETRDQNCSWGSSTLLCRHVSLSHQISNVLLQFVNAVAHLIECFGVKVNGNDNKKIRINFRRKFRSGKTLWIQSGRLNVRFAYVTVSLTYYQNEALFYQQGHCMRIWLTSIRISDSNSKATRMIRGLFQKQYCVSI